MPIAIAVAYTMLSDVAVPSLVILPYTSIEISKNDELLGSHSSDKRVKFLIEFVLDFFWVGHGRSVGTYDGCSGLFTQGNLHGHKAIIDSFWNANKLLHEIGFDCKANTGFAPLFTTTSTPEKSVATASFS